MKIGLVDELGGLDRAVAIARQRAKIPAGSDVELVLYPPRPSLFDALSHPLGQTEESSLRSALALFAPAERRVMRQVLAPMRLLRAPGTARPDAVRVHAVERRARARSLAGRTGRRPTYSPEARAMTSGYRLIVSVVFALFM